MLWLLVGLVACAPAQEPVQALGAPSVTTPQERQAVLQLGQALELRAPEGHRYEAAAQFAAALSDGRADAQIRQAAIALLVELRDEPAFVEPVAIAPVEDVVPDCVMADFQQNDRPAVAPRVVLAEDQVQLARDALRAGDAWGAIDALRPLRDTVAWKEVLPLWTEAVDGWVAQERERAGALYLEARERTGEARRSGLLEVQVLLADLLASFPESSYAEALTTNLARVEQALDPMD